MAVPALAAPAAAGTAATVATLTLPQLIQALQQAGVGSAEQPGRESVFRPALAKGLFEVLGPAAAGYVLKDITEGTPVGSNASSPGGKYLIGGQFDLDYLPYYRSELFKRNLTSLIPFIGEDLVKGLPPIESPAEASERVQQRQSQAMEAATDREIRAAQAKGLLAQELQRIMETAATERQQISSLADVQKQRVESSYGMAKDLLGNTVSSILGTIPTGRATEVQLATIM